MPTTSPSAVTSGPPELPGLAAASNWMRLVSTRLPSRRAVLALQPGDDARRDRRPDAEREADRDHLVAGRRGPPWSAAWPGPDRRGPCCAFSTARSCSGCSDDHGRVGLEPVEERHLDLVGAGDDVQVGEDDALVDDDHAGADAVLDVAVAVRVVGQPLHAHHRGAHRFGRSATRPRAGASSPACDAPRRRCPAA